jgi:prepilin-type N-terminal cleavage/methylation domain-containing protein
MKLQIESCRLPISDQAGGAASPLDAGAQGTARPTGSIANRKSQIANGFTLIEVMVVVTLLSLIVLALMTVFNATQTAFRASVTQTGVLESGRAAVDLIADDLRAMSPSSGQSNNINGAANFYATVTTYASPPSPLIQPMVGGNSSRTNVLENFFILSRGNQNGVPTWFGVGYAVATNAPPGPLYSLYRFSTNHPVAAVDPVLVVSDFFHFLTNITSGGHLMDGVVSLTVRAYDVNGGQMTNNITYSGGRVATNKNVFYFPSPASPPPFGQVGFVMFSNTLPASVEVEMGVLEDRALQRAGSIPNFIAQSNYLSQQSGKVHVFRQRVSIPNVDSAAYQ